MMDVNLDICPIIPDLPEKIKEPYNQALTKLLRANDHKIIDSYVRYEGGSVRIEITLQGDIELTNELQRISNFKIKESHHNIDIQV